MNEFQKKNVRDSLKDWGIQCARRNAFPVVLVAMQSSEEMLVWKGGGYSNSQIKRFLAELAAQIPDDNLPFGGAVNN